MSRQRKPRGRSGGRAGAAGYDFQDIYIAWQLAKLLLGDRDPILEVLWEKKAIDRGASRGAEPTHVDDAIILLRSGKRLYTQVKETAPVGGWSLRNLIRQGVAEQLWRQWQETRAEDRNKTILGVASGGIIAPLAMIIDAALRSRTPAELMSDETSAEAATGVVELAGALELSPEDPALLEFLKAVRAEQLPGSEELHRWIVTSLAPFGQLAAEVADRLVRIVARSKHMSGEARSGHTHESLVEQLRTDGLPTEALTAAGLIAFGKRQAPAFWREYRTAVVQSLRSFRVYGLEVERAVFADLPSLFVPLKLLPLETASESQGEAALKRNRRRSFAETLSEEVNDPSKHRNEPSEATDLASVLANTRRFVLLGGQGCGKTTTLRWLTVIAALEGDEGSRIRQHFCLPREPQLPLLVRFRRLADRIRARGLEGVAGRVGLVAEFLAAEFQAGIAGRVLTKDQALEVAHDLLMSEDTLLLFDALDEVPDDTVRNGLMEAVADLVRQYPAPRVVMSSRPYAFKPEHVQMEMPRFTPLPLDRAGRETFAQQWYRSVRSHLGDALSEAEAVSRGEDLAREAERVPDLAETPLLLSILALVHFNRQGLQGQRAKLYDHATLAMLGHWERDVAGRNLGDDAIPADWGARLKLQEAEIRRVVERLAGDVQVGEAGSEFTEEVAVESLARGLESVSVHGFTRERAQLLLQLLVDRSGLLQERSAGIFGFVHLSFQEYLAARRFVGSGEKALAELAKLAEDDRHAEVVRFAAGILIADQRAEADERARNLIFSVAERNGALAAACLLEAPSLAVPEKDCEELARAAWVEEWHHHRPEVMARLVWGLLNRTARADHIVLELLVQDNKPVVPLRRNDFEKSFALLALRPARAMTPEFSWFARRLASTSVQYGPPISSTCELLLVEASEDVAEKHVAGLVALVSESGWVHRSRDARGSLADRARHILRDVFSDRTRAPAVHVALTEVLRAPDSRKAITAGRFLLSLGEPLTSEFADVLVRAGVKACRWDSELCSWLATLVSDQASREMIVPRLTDSLTDDDREIRAAAARVLKEAGVVASALADDPTGESHSTRIEVLRSLLTDPSQSEEIADRLAGDLLADAVEDNDRVWEATMALLLSGRAQAVGLPRALVRAGLTSAQRRPVAAEHLRKLRTDPNQDLAVRAVLLDGLGSGDEAVAAASSLILVDVGDAVSDSRIKRIVAALLGDEKQISDALPRLRELLKGKDTQVVAKAIGEYLKTNTQGAAAAAAARLMADMGHLDAPHVAAGLALGGLAEVPSNDEALAHLKGMLEDPRLVTETRRALSRALEDSDNVAWGAAQLLWEVGAYFDPHLASALVRAGLLHDDRRQQASSWLLELLRRPETSARTATALKDCLQNLLNGSPPEFDKAWPVAQCLLEGDVVETEQLPKVLVRWGLGDSSRHDEVLAIISRVVPKHQRLAEAIEVEAWAVMNEELPSYGIQDRPWGAVRVLTSAYASPLARIMAYCCDDKRVVALIRVLLRVGENNPAAHSILAELMSAPDASQPIHGVLVRLLRDPDRAAAFGAAGILAASNDVEHFSMPRAVIVGLGGASWRGKAEGILDDIRARPSMKFALRSALCEALWGRDRYIACNTAIYMIDRGETPDLGLAMGLVYGGFHDRWGGRTQAKASRLVRGLLLDPRTREVAMGALGASLFEDDNGRSLKENKGINFETAMLLVTSGIDVDVSEALALATDERLSSFTLQLLALVALSGGVEETRGAAKRLGSAKLLDLLGPEPLQS